MPASGTGTAGSAAGTGERLTWPDVARGISIVGVVLLHISLVVPEGMNTNLARVNSLIDPMRLPLFFLISGFFSLKVLRFNAYQLFARRLWYFLVPYVIFSAAELYFKGYEYFLVFGDERPTTRMILRSVVLGHTMGWFLHALVLFNIFLWATRWLGPLGAIIASFVPLGLLGLSQEYYFVGKAVMFLPIFVAGTYLREYVGRFAAAADSLRRPRASTWVAYLGAALLWAGGRWVRRAWDAIADGTTVAWPLVGPERLSAPELLLAVRLVEQILQLPAAIVLCVLVAKIPYVSGFFRFVGVHTLPIYLAHPIALTLGFGLVQAHMQWPITLHGEWPHGSTLFWMLYCLALSAAGSTVLWAVGKLPLLGWALVPPALPTTINPRALLLRHRVH